MAEIDDNESDATAVPAKRRVLTVGDGDLSLSLALSRAYGDEHVAVTASVLESDRDEFRRVFPEAPLEELRSRNVSVLYGVDATQLHERFARGPGETRFERPWDVVSFHHPHLGESSFGHHKTVDGNEYNENNEDNDNDDEDTEARRAKLHHQLLCHYLHSASKVSELVHVCLTGSQPRTWNLAGAAARQNLTLVREFPDTQPFASVLWPTTTATTTTTATAMTTATTVTTTDRLLPEAAAAEPRFAAPRRYRNGKLGKHWLARYGYRHRRTEGVLYTGSSRDANVSESTHFVFARRRNDHECEASNPDDDEKGPPTEGTHACPVCGASFGSESELVAHQLCPVRPPPPREETPPRNEVLPEKEDRRSVPDPPGGETRPKPPPAPPPDPTQPKTAKTTLVVPSDGDGKRLRWFLQHSTPSLTKRLAESAIRDGLVSVNESIARDSSRILRADDRVAVEELGGRSGGASGRRRSSPAPVVVIVHRSPGWLVAQKPSGMRTRGRTTPGTLERLVSEQEGAVFSSLSALETSCQGLCVLVASGDGAPTRLSVTHVLTVLVHGRIPEDWLPSRNVSLSLEPKWRQKKKNSKKRKHGPEDPPGSGSSPVALPTTESPSHPPEANPIPNPRRVPAEIIPRESTRPSEGANAPGLSTLRIATAEPSSSGICHHFRNEGFPVVGDSFCKHEYSGLKRSIRNRIKDKLCIGCFGVEIAVDGGEDGAAKKHAIEVPSPDKLSARFWERFLDEETTDSGGAAEP